MSVLPETVSAARLARADHADAFAVPLGPTASGDARDWYAALNALPGPRWVRGLMKLRSRLARALRLRTADVPTAQLFPLVHGSAESVTAGLDDKHLDFRIVLEVRPASAHPEAGTRELVLTTVVQRHNRAGRCYFALIRPFHARIVPGVLRRLAEVPGPAD